MLFAKTPQTLNIILFLYQSKMATRSLLETICNICMAAGGIGTVGTLIYMIVDSKRRAKQLDATQKIQSQQLEALYEPDIRLVSSSYRVIGLAPNDLVFENHGEDLRLLDIRSLSDYDILNSEGMKGWFPYDFDKGSEIHVPLSIQLIDLRGTHNIGFFCTNKLGLTYLVSINIVEGKPTVQRPVLQ